MLKTLQEESEIDRNVLKKETIYVDDLIEELELFLLKIDEKLKPEHIASAVTAEKFVSDFRHKEYMYELLGVNTEDIKKDVAKMEVHLGNYRETAQLRKKITDLLEKARKLKSEGKEYAIIPVNH
ncbi:MAG: hypothetical protein WC788_01050 [Candidatus Paceibacterota bacterium]